MLCEEMFVFIFFGVALRAEEAHVLSEVGEAREGAGIARRSGRDAYGGGEVFGLDILCEEGRYTVLEAEGFVLSVVGIALDWGCQVGHRFRMGLLL